MILDLLEEITGLRMNHAYIRPGGLAQDLPEGAVEHIREFLTITLGRDGFEVVAAASGPEALRAMQEAPADLALVDLKMPGMDGLEVLRRLKEVSETVAVVIVTAQIPLTSAASVAATKQSIKTMNTSRTVNAYRLSGSAAFESGTRRGDSARSAEPDGYDRDRSLQSFA